MSTSISMLYIHAFLYGVSRTLVGRYVLTSMSLLYIMYDTPWPSESVMQFLARLKPGARIALSQAHPIH